MKRKERITWTPSTTTSLSTTRLTSSSTRSAPAATSENPTSSHELSLNLEKGTVRDGNMGSEEGRLVGMIGKIQNLSSSVGFITRTLEGNCLYVISYDYIRSNAYIKSSNTDFVITWPVTFGTICKDNFRTN